MIVKLITWAFTIFVVITILGAIYKKFKPEIDPIVKWAKKKWVERDE